MTPEEKAKELIEKFIPWVTTWDCYNDIPVPEEDVVKDAAKCALICVEEILHLLDEDFGVSVSIKKLYWNEVLTSINK